MPKMKGPELYQALKDLNLEMKAIFITGHHINYLKNLPEDGRWEMVTKPFMPDELLSRVRAGLGMCSE